MTATTWPCPGCQHREPIPNPPVGVIMCSACESYGYSLDDGGLEGIPDEPLPIDESGEPIKKLGDCGGCTDEESREFEARFGELDKIDREFRLSKLNLKQDEESVRI